MLLNDEKLTRLIEKSSLLSREELSQVKLIAEKAKKPLAKTIVEHGFLNEKNLAQAVAEELGIQFVDLTTKDIDPETLKIIPEPVARERNVILWQRDDSTAHVAMLNPQDRETIEFLKRTAGRSIQPYLTTSKGIRHALILYRKGFGEEFEKLISENAATAAAQGKRASIDVEDVPVVKLMDTIIEYAVSEEASDIHVEPTRDRILVRFRVDGILRDVVKLPKVVHSALVARIKVMAELKIDESRIPQDGRFRKEIHEEEISFRVSTVPAFNGEKVVMRLLVEGQKQYSLDELGLEGVNLKYIKEAMAKPYGLILSTGPTGSGKTTTLYTIMSILNTPEVNISTVEDPVEYSLSRVNQIQVNEAAGLGFVNGLRALLRQDPDIIMVGEIRDDETASMAIHSSLTGHLVLSTLHTNNAAGALPRLVEMGIEPYLLADTMEIVMAQRLVRKLCQHCIESYTLDRASLRDLEGQIDFAKTIQALTKAGVLSKRKRDIKELRFYRSRGCEQCGRSGYRGRVGIYEVIYPSDEIRRLIVKGGNALALQEQAVSEGMITMAQDGIGKALRGLTSIAEVLRVTKE